MSSPEIILKKTGHDSLLIELVGDIDGSADFSSICMSDITQITINFQRITLLDSLGIQKWISFLKTVPENITITFQECSIPIVHQLTLTPDFMLGNKASVVSFFAPYYCDSCSESKNIILESKAVLSQDGTVQLPEFNCPQCKNHMEFDGLPEKYAVFLKKS